MRKTILICGKATSGKSTFATLLMQELNKNIDKPRAKVINNGLTVKTYAESCFHWDKEKDARGRQLLLDITNAGYNYDTYFWEKETEMMFRKYQSVYETIDVLIVPDWRFEKTHTFFKNMPGEVITVEVNNPNIPKGTHDDHPSENDFKNFHSKYYIDNSKDINHLENLAKTFLEMEGLR